MKATEDSGTSATPIPHQSESRTGEDGTLKGGKRRRRPVNPEARARIVAARKARWASFPQGRPSKPTRSNLNNRATNERFSPATCRALAEAARKRWVAARASGKSTL
jgi:hypothetical protein